MMNSGDLIAKYGNKQSTNISVSAGEKQSKVTKPDYNRYASKDFKEFMGYEEPDYLRAAGLYDSCERGKQRKIYGGFLVKKADYVAEKLKWFDENGKPDIKRAETAIRTACRTKAPNGLFYMYSKSNKNHCLSEKGGSRIYVSGRRNQEIEFERLALEAKYQDVAPPEKAELKREESEFELVKRLILRAAAYHNLSSFHEGAVVWVAKHLLSKLDTEDIQWYLDLLVSDEYRYHVMRNKNCPQICGIFDIFNKYDKIVRYVDRQ